LIITEVSNPPEYASTTLFTFIINPFYFIENAATQNQTIKNFESKK